MNTSLKVGGGLVAACAACCALSVVPAVIAATSVAAFTSWAFGGGIAALALGAVGVGLYLLRHRPRNGAPHARKFIADARQEACGCGSPRGAEEPPIACTLEAGDFKRRSADIRDLARRALKDAKRTPLSLTLVYDAEVADEVRALMAKEQECCPFLTFGLKQSSSSVELAIVAPPSAREAADALFDHFAPELATTKEIV